MTMAVIQCLAQNVIGFPLVARLAFLGVIVVSLDQNGSFVSVASRQLRVVESWEVLGAFDPRVEVVC